MPRRATLAVGLGLVTVLGSCAGPPAPSAAPSAAASPATSTRPRTLSMQGLDPCSVFTDVQLRQVGVAREKQRTEAPSPATGNEPTCVWLQYRSSDPSTALYVQGVTYLGVDDVLARAKEPATVIDVRGFRAVRRENPLAGRAGCQVYVDVADGQALQVAYSFSDPARDPALACTTAVTLADTALANLLGR